MTTAFHSIYFDCDSTLSTIEGIDELARAAGPAIEREVAKMTDAAMDGSIPMVDVYGRRLEIIRPTAAALAAVADAYVANLVPDTASVVRALQFLGKHVGVVSGGLLPAVRGLAAHLGIENSRVFAVDAYFDPTGAYTGFEHDSPLARNGGKPELLVGTDPADRPMAFIGDGITDLEAAHVVERFIGFGGVANRDRVRREAECFADGPSLADVLQFCLTPAETRQLAEHPDFRHLIE